MDNWIAEWHPTLYHFLSGAFGGFVGMLGSTGGWIPLPCIKKRDGRCGLDFGFLSPVVIGGFVGWTVDHHIMYAGLGGYIGVKALDAIIYRLFPELKDKEDCKDEDKPIENTEVPDGSGASDFGHEGSDSSLGQGTGRESGERETTQDSR